MTKAQPKGICDRCGRRRPTSELTHNAELRDLAAIGELTLQWARVSGTNSADYQSAALAVWDACSRRLAMPMVCSDRVTCDDIADKRRP